MGKLFTALKRLPKRTSAFVAVIAAAIIVPATLFAWGPDRQTFTMAHPADHVTFNSITDNPNYGDEREFMTVKDLTTGGQLTNTAKMIPGHEYQFQVYVHNNAATSLNESGVGVAKDVKVRAQLPATVNGTETADAFVSASNATPKEVWDSAALTSDSAVSLQFVNGSAKLHTNSQQASLPDSVITTGATVGDKDLTGDWRGCLQYAGAVTFKVKVNGTPNFKAEKLVSKHGANQWGKNYTATPGETVDYLVKYANTGTTQQDNVVLKDTLPAGMTYIPGSSVLGNYFHPSGIKTNDGITTSTGINIGSYSAGANAWVKFSAKTPANDQLPVCGNNLLHNVAKVETDNGSKEDSADVTVPKECKPECKYSCDNLAVEKLSDTKFKFTTSTTEQNATFKKVTYVIRNEQGVEVERKESTAKTLEYTRTTVGKFTVEAHVTFTVDGAEKTVTSASCKKPFEVTELPKTPVYTCDALTVSKMSRTEYSFTGKATATNGAEIVSYSFDFGDNTAPQTVTNPTAVKHTYAKDGTYTAKLSVTVKVNGQDKVVTDDTKCVVKVTVSPEECKPGIPVGDERCNEKPEECKPGIPVGDERCTEKPSECKPGIPTGDSRCENCALPGKEHLPKDSKDCAELPAELPKTGNDNLFALVGAGSLIAAVGYYVASRRSLI